MRDMISPFTRSASCPGQGTIAINVLPPGLSNLYALTYAYPLKLISPSATATATAKSVLVFLLTYGGGLVAGDGINLGVTLAPAARLSLVTQGSTKVFRATSRDIVSRQLLDVRIERNAALVYLPDPVQPFKESVYEQRQVYRLDPRAANLCALDWVSEGRTARGEKWELWDWKSRTEVYLAPDDESKHHDKSNGTLLLRDNVFLEGDGGAESLAQRMEGVGVLGTLILRGQMFEHLGKHFLDEFSALPRIGARGACPPSVSSKTGEESARLARQKRETAGDLLWTAASVRGIVVVKFGAGEVEHARQWLKEMIRGEGTIEREFGEGSLLGLR